MTQPITERWACSNCNTDHDTYTNAAECCPPEMVFGCATCGTAYGDEDLAVECCESAGEDGAEQ